MRNYLLYILLLIPCPGLLFAQGSGIGYQFDYGGSNFSHSSPHYSQSMRTMIHNGFVRFHSKDGSNAVKLMFGYRADTVHFQNYSWYMGSTGEMEQFNVNAYLQRSAWRLGIINQVQFGRPGRFVFALNTGGFYEHSVKGKKYSYGEGVSYVLDNELRTHNLGVILGGELRLGWFTVGARYEKLLRDVLNHDYILSQELGSGNSSELRGVKMNPGMGFIYLGVNLDFFSED